MTARWTLALLLTLALPATAAQPRYVTDSILLGVHAEASWESPILRTVPSGTEVQVLEARDGFAQVRVETTTGWVDAGYLTEEQPARVLLTGLAEQYKAALAELGSLRAAVPTGGDEAVLADLRAAAEAAKARIAELEAERTALRAQLEAAADQPQPLQPVVARTADQSEARIEELEAQNALLAQRIALALDGLTGELTPVHEPARERAAEALQDGVWPWYLAAPLVALLLGFVLGMLWLDYRNRMRHGGIRL